MDQEIQLQGDAKNDLFAVYGKAKDLSGSNDIRGGNGAGHMDRQNLNH